MARSLFDQSLVSAPRRTRSRWTVAASCALHAALIAALLAVPIVSGIAAPDVARSLDRFVVATLPPPPPPPAVQSVAPSLPPAVDPDAAPVVAPDRQAPEPATAPSGGTPFGPGGPPGPGIGIPGSVEAPGQIIRFHVPAVPPAPVRPGGDITPPDRQVYVAPLYPEIARVSRIEGTVILEAVIGEVGLVTDVRVLRSVAMLDDAAIAAVRQWRYSPTKLNGVPVPVLLTVTVRFALK
jgi:protein TonB